MIKQHEKILNLDNYQMVPLTPEEMQETKGGWIWTAIGIGVALYIAYTQYAHQYHRR